MVRFTIPPPTLICTPGIIHFPHLPFSTLYLTHTDIITLTFSLPIPHTYSLLPRNSGTYYSLSLSRTFFFLFLSLPFTLFFSLFLFVSFPPPIGNRYDMLESVRTLRHSVVHNGLSAETHGEEQDLGPHTL